MADEAIVEQPVDEKPEEVKPYDTKSKQAKLYGVEFRNLNTGGGHIVNVVATNAKEALDKVASQVTSEEIIWEVKFLAEVHA